LKYHLLPYVHGLLCLFVGMLPFYFMEDEREFGIVYSEYNIM